MCRLPHGRCRFRIFSQAKPRGYAYTECSMEGQSVSTVVWRFILGRKDDCLFYLRYYYSANCRTYAYEEHLQCFQELFAAVEQTFKPEANVNMLLHQVFDTMLSFAARVLGGEMPDDDATTQWAFEQIYSFVVPNVREELLIPSGSTPV